MKRRFVKQLPAKEDEPVAPPPPFPRILPGGKDPNRPGVVLVPVDKAPKHPAFPKVGPDIAPQTFYRVAPKEQRVLSFVTLSKDGHSYAWDTCGSCIQHWTQCACTLGILHPDSIEWCVRKQNGWADGEPINFDVNMEAYRKARRASYRFNADRTATTSPSTRKSSKAFIPPKAEPKPRGFVRTKAGSGVVRKDVTLSDINKAAADVAAEVESMLDMAPRRTRVYKRRKKS